METLSLNTLVSVLSAWMTSHPYLASLVIFLTVLLEGLFVLGLFIPGTLVMFTIGALVAMGVVNIWLALFSAALGAFVGDSISYYIGHYFRDDLRFFLLFRKYPTWLPKAEIYCHQYGSKSVVLGRFIGPLRPFIPAVSGMLGMSGKKFLLIDAFASFIWSPCYMLPGIVLGASLSFIAGIAGRLAILLGLVFSISWLTVWLVRQSYRYLQPRLNNNLDKTLYWSYRHPVIGRFITGLLQHNQPELGALFQSFLMLMLGFWGFLALLLMQIYDTNLSALDLQVYGFFQQIHSTWGDAVMVFFMNSSDTGNNMMISGVCALWLGMRRHWLALEHFGFVLLLGFFSALIFNINITLENPLPLNHQHIGFPDIHMSVSTVIYGFLAVLIAEELPSRWQRLPYTLAGLWLVGIIISKLYLNLQLLLPLIAGSLLGLMLVALFGIAYRRHSTPEVGSYGLLLTLFVCQIGVTVWLLQQPMDKKRYFPAEQSRQVSLNHWQKNGWQTLPLLQTAAQTTLFSLQQPQFNFQWAETQPIIQQHLQQQGWQLSPPIDWTTAFDWFQAEPVLADWAILPKTLYGQTDSLRLFYMDKDQPQTRWILRLWSSHSHLPNKKPIWLGEISAEQLKNRLYLMTITETIKNKSANLAQLDLFLHHCKVLKKNNPNTETQVFLITTD